MLARSSIAKVARAAVAVLLSTNLAFAQAQQAPEKPPCERYRELTGLFIKGFIDLAQRIIDNDSKKGLSLDRTLRNMEAFSKDRDDPATIIGAAHVAKNLRLALDFCLDNVGQVFKSPKTNMPLGCGVMVGQMMPASGEASTPADQVMLPLARGMLARAWEIVQPMADTENEKRRTAILFSAFRRCYPR